MLFVTFFLCEMTNLEINVEKVFWENGRKITLSINIEQLGKNEYRIKDFYHSEDGETFIHHGDKLRNNQCIYKISQKFGKNNKLMFNNKAVKPEEFGTLTCYSIGKNIVIPVSLIDEAIEMF